MKRGLFIAFLLSTLFGVGGCSVFEYLDANRTLSPDAVAEQQREPPAQDEGATRTVSAEPYLTRARQLESKGEFQRSLHYLQVAAAIDSQNSHIPGRIERIQNVIATKSEAHFKKGLEHHRQGGMEKAKKEWLTALRINPGHRGALSMLKVELTRTDTVAYELKPGDTPEKISKKVYHTPGRGWLVAYFYDFKSGKGPVPGDVIRLPVIDPELLKPRKKAAEPVMDIKAEVARAEHLIQEKRYDEALKVTEKILDYDYLNHDAARLVNAVYYGKGLGLYRQDNYPDALEVFRKVDPKYLDTAARISELEGILNRQAEEHYLEGVKFFINEDLERAIQSWELTLKLNPDHEKAETDIEGAKKLLEKLGTVE